MISLKRFCLPAFFISVFYLIGCKRDPSVNERTIPTPPGTSTPTPYKLQLPASFPKMKIPVYNPLTEEGVALGRKLFYDPLLSGNNKQSCEGCHQQNASFVDLNVRLSKGSTGAIGFRNSMPLFNVGYANAWFWDGRAKTLEEQIFHPITSQMEMNQDPNTIGSELSVNPQYRKMFTDAFGEGEINFDKTAKALAQFLRTIIAYTPKSFDTSLLSAAEKRGLFVFNDENKGDCFHCHELGNFMTNFKFANNGLNIDPTTDQGLASVTRVGDDLGKFKVPSLINIKYTAPYMHDGRFKTLREVLDFYDHGFHYNNQNLSLDGNLIKHVDPFTRKPIPRKWNEQDKDDLIAFLNGLTDESLLTKSEYSK